MTDDIRLCRTFQTAPAAVSTDDAGPDDAAKYLRSALTAEGFRAPDWLVPDLEDGTAPGSKRAGVENVVELVPSHDVDGEVWPRVEWSHLDETVRDAGRDQIDALVAGAGDDIDGFVVPKVGRRPDVERAVDVVSEVEAAHGYEPRTFDLTVVVETSRARSDLRPIARFGADSRLAAIAFGPLDYAADLGSRDLGDRPRWDGTLEALSNEASAAGLLSIGGPFDDLFTERAGVTYYNGDAYVDRLEHEAAIGIDGSWSLHPNQTVQANTVHMPSPDALERDVDRIERYNRAKRGGTGAVVIDGRMVDEASLKGFHNTIRRVRAIDRIHPAQTDAYYDDDLLKRALDLDLTR
ncbi:beta-methylmalyl-CoA/L-malyl-CoA lyase [Halopenitus malekzadehii]|uniref:Beta-methylmalyl-CoA/L-malyl-CoA lyase n=1 Tax=Halopenitus malekzadehii TaxID=1267564 RepID=A0A1H6JYY5_9EURY|nr:L-malyl-CoA/beta-methylmalyl-CoA lyase [Halopenitus malekzadehii]SEH65847.1 beta-methylmalyl-CoA/L-malyl-CoA lyase [Halopenitus malekzadehii]